MNTEEMDLQRLRKELDEARNRIALLQDELAWERETLRAVFDSTSDLYMMKDRGSVYRSVNAVFCNFLGRRNGEIVGRTDDDIFSPEDARCFSKGDVEVMESRVPETAEVEVESTSGRVWLQVIKTPVLDHDGNVAGVLCSARDISRQKQAELELEKLLGIIPDLVSISSADGLFLRVNPAWEKILGYTEAELLAIPYQDLIHPEDREATRMQVELRRQGQGASTFINRYLAKDGSYRWLEWNSAPADGNILYSVARDITSRIAQEKETRLWADAFRYCSHGIAIGLPDTNSILTCNEAFARMHGQTVAEIEGAPILSMYVPEDHEKVMKQLHEADRKRAVSFEARMVRRDWTVFPVQMDIVTIVDDRGNLAYRIATIQDITERQNSQMALLESEVRFRSLVESAPEGIFVQTRGNFAYLNPTAMRMFGATAPGQIIGLPILDQLHPDFRNLVAERIRMVNSELVSVPLLEETMLRLDGTAFEAELSAVPFVYAGQHGALVFMRDITARKQVEKERLGLEKQLFQSQKLESIGRLAGGIAHDLNNLLTPILGYSEIMALKLPAHDVGRQHLNVMHDAALRARDLIRRLLVFSSTQVLEFGTLDLNAVVTGFEHLLRRTLRANVGISCNYHEGVLPMLGDSCQIEQIIMNLAINADDSMPSGGTLKIVTSKTLVQPGEEPHFEGIQEGCYALLSVCDTGAGMDSETIAHIFEPFFTTKPKGKGTGLGLSTVYGIVKQHDGYIRVSSEQDKGTCIRIYFPMQSGNVTIGVPQKGTASAKVITGTVLVVEDDELVRQLVVQSLLNDGLTVSSAASGEEALEMLTMKTCQPDLLVTDLVMKGVNGKELYDRTRKLLPKLRVIYMSGYTKNIISSHGVHDKGISFLQKPFTVKALSEKVRSMMGS